MLTCYGYKIKGFSKFVIVAPHAAGDDVNTDKVAELVAKKLNAFLIVNTKFRKKVENFNELSWHRDHYNWTGKKEEMKEFFSDIKEFSKLARNNSEEDKAVVIYIHGLKNTRDIGIDIGAGLKENESTNEIKGATGKNRHPDAGNNTGEEQVDRKTILKLKNKLNQMLEKSNLRATIGIEKAAWSRQNAVQFHANTLDDSMQFEIVYALRKNKQKIGFISNILAGALLDVYETK